MNARRAALGVLSLLFAVPLSAVELLRVTPSQVCLTGGEEMTFAGTGLTASFRARLSGVELENQVFTDGRAEKTIRGTVPAMTVTGLKVGEIFDPRAEQVVARLPSAVDVIDCAPPPEITEISPREVSTTGGTPVKIVGMNLTRDMELRLDGVPLSIQVFADPRTIYGVTPELPEGQHDLVLNSASGNPLGSLSPAVIAKIPPTLFQCLFKSKNVSAIQQSSNTGQTPQLNAGMIQTIQAPVSPGQVGHATSYLGLVSQLSGAQGIQGWSLSLSLQGELLVESATVSGTVGDDVSNGPPGLRNGGFERTEIVDPSVIHPDTGLPQGQGVVSVVILSLLNPSIQLDPVGTATVLQVKVGTDHPLAAAETISGSLRGRDRMKGTGQPVKNEVVIGAANYQICSMQKLNYDFYDSTAAALIQKVEPSLVSTLGGTKVVITGQGFREGLEWQLGAASLTDVEVIDFTHARGKTPRLSEGFQQATLRDARGNLLTHLDRAVEAAPPPEVLSVEPHDVEEGTEVVIRGRNLRRETEVLFGAFGILDAHVSDDGTQILGRAPESDFPGDLPVRTIDPRLGSSASQTVAYKTPGTSVPPPERLFLLLYDQLAAALECLFTGGPPGGDPVLCGDGRLDVLDLKTFQVVESFDVVSGESLEVSPSGNRVYVTRPDGIFAYRVSTGELQATYEFPGKTIVDCQISANGARLYVALEQSLAEVNTSTDAVIQEVTISHAGSLGRLGIAPDGKTLGCIVKGSDFGENDSLVLIDTATLHVKAAIPIHNPLRDATCVAGGDDIAFSNDGRAFVYDRYCDILYAFDVTAGTQLTAQTVNVGQELYHVDGTANLLAFSNYSKAGYVPQPIGVLEILDPATASAASKGGFAGQVHVPCATPSGKDVYAAVYEWVGPDNQFFFSIGRYDPKTNTVTPEVYDYAVSMDNILKEVIDLRATGPGPAKPPRSVIPGDTNGDFKLDLSDAVALLGHLFLGRPTKLPCGDGTANDPANIALLDANGDHKVDLSDGVHVLAYLFLGTRPPVGGTQPVDIDGCGAAGL